MRLSQRLAQASLNEAAALSSLDALDTGVTVVDRHGRLHHVSTVAEAMLDRLPTLRIRHGRLCARDPAVNARLQAALHQTIGLAAGKGSGIAPSLRVERPDGPPCTLAFAPLRPRSLALPWAEPLGLILLRDPEFPPFRIEHLRTIFGLTRMEAMTAAELARGRTLAEIGGALGVGIGTVRTHLKQILLKTETNRQAEAVAVLTRSVAAMPPHGDLSRLGEDRPPSYPYNEAHE